jgi:hypothetical protein
MKQLSSIIILLALLLIHTIPASVADSLHPTPNADDEALRTYLSEAEISPLKTDGYSDVWVKRMAGGTVQPAESDLDGDGIPFHAEHALGLSPNQPNTNFFRILHTDRHLLELHDVSGVNYALDEATDLTTGNWLAIPLSLPGDSDPAPYHIWIPTNEEQTFWRIRGIGFQDSADGDAINDYEEYLLGTDPQSSDSDADKIADDIEFATGLDPTQSLDIFPADGLPDDWVAFHLLSDGATGDDDLDGISNLEEFTTGTHPQINAFAPPGQGVRIKYHYDADGRLLQLQHNGSAATVYAPDPAHNLRHTARFTQQLHSIASSSPDVTKQP